MKHFIFHSSHYDAGYQQGAALLEQGERIPEQAPFPLTRRRLDFARACLPVYEQWFPAVLEEIRGIADGNRCPFEAVTGILLPMYCFAPQIHCSCFAIRRGGQTLLGRNSDFLTAIEDRNANCLYRLTGGARAFLGNTTAFIEMEDGVNAQGLAAGLTSVYPGGSLPGLNAGMLLRLVLETCGDVSEALSLLCRAPTASSHTLVLADRSGDLALVESCGAHMAVRRPEGPEGFVCAVNTFHLPEMVSRNHPEGDNWRAEERYETLVRALSAPAENQPPLQEAMDLLSGRRGFLCQYDRSTGKDTVWSALYDLSGKRVYRAGANPGRTPFCEDRRLSIAE